MGQVTDTFTRIKFDGSYPGSSTQRFPTPVVGQNEQGSRNTSAIMRLIPPLFE